MSEIKYASPESMQANINETKERLAKKLTVVDVIPSFKVTGTTVLYIGATTTDYIQGGIYQWNGTEWKLISAADVDLTNYETSWTGTTSAWALLDPTEQAQYQVVNFTDDYTESGVVTGIVAGYYYDGKFYEDAQHTTEISGLVGYIYIDLTSDKTYLYNGSAFVICSGEGGGVVEGYYYNDKFYEDAQHTTEITGQSGLLYVDVSTNYVYRYDITQSEFVRVSGGSSYTAGHGISIDNGVISDKTFVGTTAQWESLTSAQQAFYEERVLTDDEPDVQQKTNGHTIKNEDGVSKTQRSNLQFEGLDVTDDDVNDKTIVAPTTLKEEVYSVMGQMGAKNLLPRALTNIITHNTSGSWNGNNYTINGVTFTVNSDGGITANGTATASNTSLFIYGGVYGALQENFLVKDVPYKLSSGIVNNVKAYIKWQSFLDNSGTLVEQGDSRNENLAITEDAPYIRFMCHVENGTTVTNLTFYPMIRLATDTDDTYQPYAKTNRELTEDVEELSTNATKVVTLPTDISIFDILADDTTYPAKCTYWKRAQDVTNGADNFPTLLGVNNDSIVRVDKYSKYYIGIEVNDASHGKIFTAWGNNTTSSLKFVKIDTATSPYVSQVTINKATT